MAGFDVKIEGSDAIKLRLNKMAQKYAASYRLRVGYSAPYSIFVHERLDVFHPNGTAKFLENAARRAGKRIGRNVGQRIKRGMAVRDSLMMGGEELLAESNDDVPVDTGFLLSSGFVKMYSTGGH